MSQAGNLPAVFDSYVSFRFRDQFCAFMMAGHERCGVASPARTVCRCNPSLVRQLWDSITSSSATVLLGILWGLQAGGITSHCVRFRVSPLTLGIVGDVTTSNCEYQSGDCVTDTVFYSNWSRIVNTVNGEETTIVNMQGTLYFSSNNKWMICLGMDNNWRDVFYVAKVTDLRFMPPGLPGVPQFFGLESAVQIQRKLCLLFCMSVTNNTPPY
ncbi:hypothetical protein Pelo_18228 [Pelomyxa schiedti]|nr:hypothetical protein Pelo_18228 [Pelomyxa schiedti]